MDAETLTGDVMEALLHSGFSDISEGLEWFGDTALRVNFGNGQSFIISVEVE